MSHHDAVHSSGVGAGTATAGAHVLSADGAAPTQEPNPIERLGDALRDRERLWPIAAVFDAQGRVLASTFDVEPAEIDQLVHAFDGHDITVTRGIDFDGAHFDVHRYYDNIMYGREPFGTEGDGFAMSKTIVASSRQPVFAIVSFPPTVLTAQAVPELRRFCQNYVETL